MTRTIHYCNFCDYKSDRRYDRDKHVSRKHANDHSTPSQTGSGAVQSVQPPDLHNLYNPQDFLAGTSLICQAQEPKK